MTLVSRGISVQVHAPLANTSSTSEIEFQIAAFLLFAGEYSYFMSSPAGAWTPSSPIWHRQYNYRLGKPLEDAYSTNEMRVVDGVDNLFTEVQPGYNTTRVQLAGIFDSFAPCQELCEMSERCLSFQWTQQRAAYSAWAGLCYHRFDTTWSPIASTAAVSGLKFAKWRRSFENVHVEVDFLAYSSTLDWH